MLESDHPVLIDSYAYRDASPPKSAAEQVEIARDWIPAGVESMIPQAIRAEGETANLFLINPNHSEMTFEYSVSGRTAMATVPARSSRLVPIPPEFYCPLSCGGGTRPFGAGIPLHIVADAPYLAAVSSRSPWLAVVRIARPLEE
jgi:hypothetical protein